MNDLRNYLALGRPECPECGEDRLALLDVEPRVKWKCRGCGARYEGENLEYETFVSEKAWNVKHA
jgi:ribosomal protein L37AE/L43A